jgi:hypothetical protein
MQWSKWILDIAILTLATSHIASYSRFSFANKLRYAQRHGYDFFFYTSALDRTRPPAWSKVRVLQRHLLDYDWVLWTDADSLIMNHSIPLQSILSRIASQNMIMTPGPRDKYNTGQWLVRSCDWSAAILQQIWDEVDLSKSWYLRNPWEQRALAELVKRTHLLANYIFVPSMREMKSRPESMETQLAVNALISKYLLPVFGALLGVTVYILRTASADIQALSFRAYNSGSTRTGWR